MGQVLWPGINGERDGGADSGIDSSGAFRGTWWDAVHTGGVGAPGAAGTVVVRAGPALAAHCADAVSPLAAGRAIGALMPRGVVVTGAVIRIMVAETAFPPGG